MIFPNMRYLMFLFFFLIVFKKSRGDSPKMVEE